MMNWFGFKSIAGAGIIGMLVLGGCAPQELTQSGPGEGVVSGGDTQTTTQDSATTNTVARDGQSTEIVQFPVAAAPEGFNLPWPDALPAVDMKETGKHGGTLTISVIGDPKTFDPITSNESSSNQVLSQMFANLLGYDLDEQTYYPLLLKSLEVEDDQRTWVATLRDGLKWSDGHPLTTDDVMFSAEVIFDPEILNSKADILKVEDQPLKFEKVDDLTFKVIAAKPTGFMHVMLGVMQPIPKHILEESYRAGTFTSAMNVNIDPEKLVVSGPFKLRVYQPGERVVLVRNEHYFRVDREGKRLPYLDSVVFSIAPDLDSMVAKFRSGQADTLDSPRPEIVPDLRDAQERENFTLYDKGPGNTASFFWVNQKQGTDADGKPYVREDLQEVFADVKFRKALNHAVNRDGMIRTVLRGLAVKATGLTPIALKDWYNPDVTTYEYDVEKAKALLDEAGYVDSNGDGIRETKSGQPLAFTFVTNVENKTRIELSTIIATDLKAIGIQATPQSVDFNTLITQLNDTFQYEACLLGLTGSINPITSMNVWRSSARLHLWNPGQESPETEWEAEIDRLAEEFAVALDFDTQQRIFFEMQQIMSDNVPVVFMYYPRTFSCIRTKFGNVRPSPFADINWNAEELFIKE